MFKKTFKGGVHPDDGKRYAKDASYRTYLPQGELVFPMSQHIGKPAKPVVKKGDMVLAGQLLGEADGFVSANIVSSCSSALSAITRHLAKKKFSEVYRKQVSWEWEEPDSRFM